MIPISQGRKLRLRKLSDLPRFYSKAGLFYFKAHTQTLGYCVYRQLYMARGNKHPYKGPSILFWKHREKISLGFLDRVVFAFHLAGCKSR